MAVFTRGHGGFEDQPEGGRSPIVYGCRSSNGGPIAGLGGGADAAEAGEAIAGQLLQQVGAEVLDGPVVG